MILRGATQEEGGKGQGNDEAIVASKQDLVTSTHLCSFSAANCSLVCRSVLARFPGWFVVVLAHCQRCWVEGPCPND